MTERLSIRRPSLILLLLLLASGAAYALLLTIEPRRQMGFTVGLMALLFVLYSAMLLVVSRSGEPDSHLPLMLVAALLFRLTLLPLGVTPAPSPAKALHDDFFSRSVSFRSNLFLDDDVWRYLWDGHVAATIGNPYRYAPVSPALDSLVSRGSDAALWSTIRSRVNHSELTTIYPPVAQLVFVAAHALGAGSVLAMKLLLVGCDLVAMLFLLLSLRRAKLAASRVMFYALNPLVIVMFAGAAHLDVVMVAFLSMTVYFLLGGSRRRAGVALGLAIAAKLTPLLLLPLLVRRLGRWGVASLAATIALVSAPFVFAEGGGFGSFGFFARNWDFNSASFQLLRAAAAPLGADPGYVARVVAGLLLVAVTLTIAWRERAAGAESFPTAAAATLAALLLLSPVVMPWYATWPLAFAPLCRRPAALLWGSALVCLSFPMTIDWQTNHGWLAAEYGALTLVVMFIYAGEARRVIAAFSTPNTKP